MVTKTATEKRTSILAFAVSLLLPSKQQKESALSRFVQINIHKKDVHAVLFKYFRSIVLNEKIS